MKRSRFTEEQIIGVLKEHQAGLSASELCRKHGISDATFYNWRSKYGGMEVSEAKRLKALEHEKYVTSLINAIYAAAYEVKDFRTMQVLDWFVKEQGEEEKNATDMITKMELFGGDSKGLYMLNSELKGRVYSAPSLTL